MRSRIRAELTDKPVGKNQVTAFDKGGIVRRASFLNGQANHSQKVTSAAGRWRALCILCTALVLSMSSWFSATAITPELRDAWKLSGPLLDDRFHEPDHGTGALLVDSSFAVR